MMSRKKKLAATAFILVSSIHTSVSHNFDDFFVRHDNSPSNSPSSIISNFPSFVPTGSPSQISSRRSRSLIAPSISPSKRPSQAKEVACHVSYDGFYGDNESHLLSDYIHYSYQIEYQSGSRINRIVDNLENAISNSILKSTSIFRECVPQEERILIRSQLDRKLGEGIVGLSSNPADVLTQDTCPNSAIFDSSSCVVMRGIMTIFYKDDTSRRLEQKNEIIRVIEDGMGNGSLSLSDDDIIDLQYLPFHNWGYLDSEEDPRKNRDNPDPVFNLRNVSYILLASGSIVLIGLAGIKWRQMRGGIVGIQRQPDVSRSIDINVLDDESTNFMNSIQASESSLFAKWRMAGVS